MLPIVEISGKTTKNPAYPIPKTRNTANMARKYPK